jgi:hypothetical protein
VDKPLLEMALRGLSLRGEIQRDEKKKKKKIEEED